MEIIFLLIISLLVFLFFIFRLKQKSAGVSETISLKTFDQYKILRLLKHGGMATVYEAEDMKNGNKVALKILDESFLTDKDLVTKFLVEGRILEHLQNKYPESPIIKVFKHSGTDFDYKTRPFVAMELVKGTDLDDLLKVRKFTYEEATLIIREVAKALKDAHAEEVWHRDVSPGNIMVRLSDQKIRSVKVIDFGVARNEFLGKPTPDGSIHGKPPFMSPEQCRNERVDGRSDIYALGIVYFTIITGRPPFYSTNPLEIMEMHNSASLPLLPESVPDDIKNVISKMLQKSREERYQSMSEVISALHNLRALNGINDTIDRSSNNEIDEPIFTEDEPSKFPRLALTGGLVLFVLVGSIVYQFLNQEPPVRKIIAQPSSQDTEAGNIWDSDKRNESVQEITFVEKGPINNNTAANEEEPKSFPENINAENNKAEVLAKAEPLPLIMTDKSDVAFNSTEVYTSSTEQFTISNTSSKKLFIDEIRFVLNPEGSFELVNISLPIELNKNASYSIPVRFSPNSSGQKTGSIEIINNAQKLSISLRGYGTSPEKINIAAALEKGKAALAANEYSDAETEYNIVLRQDPIHPGAFFNRGIARYEQGNYRDAASDFDNAYKHSSSVPKSVRSTHRCNCQYYSAMCAYSLWDQSKNVQQKSILKNDAIYKLESFIDNCSADKVFHENAKKYLNLLNNN